jgi:DNA repair protein RecO (recombination protein O)
MEHHETTAVLLRYYNYGESSRLFIFFTRDFGKVKLIAKGARKSKKRHLTTIDLLTYQRIHFKEKEHRELQSLDSIKMIEPFLNIRGKLSVISIVLYFAELIDEFFKEQEKNEQMFDNFLTFLIRFDKGFFRLSDIPIFQLKVLENAGLAPNLTSCINCGSPLDKYPDKSLRFNNAKGGCICEECFGNPDNKFYGKKISLGTIKNLNLAKNSPLKNLGRVNFTKSTLKEAIEVLSEFIKYHLNKSLKSYEYLQRILELK